MPNKFALVMRWNHDGLLAITCDADTAHALYATVIEPLTEPEPGSPLDVFRQALGRALVVRGEGSGSVGEA